MKALFKRELRRLLPYGLGAPLALIVIWLAVAFLSNERINLDVLGLLVVPGLLGVASVAPDTSSGGTAFLARLPLSPSRVVGVKLAAAATWSALGAVMLLGLYSVVVGAPNGLGEALLLGAFSFGAGALASVVANRTMPAILLAPALGVTTALVGLIVPTVALEMYPISKSFTGVTMSTFAMVLLALAFAAYARGDRHRRSFRPAAYAGGGLAAALCLGFATTAAAHTWTVDSVVPDLDVPRGTAAKGDVLAVPLRGRYWTGTESRVVVFHRSTQEAWVVPVRGVRRPEISPDGKQLLLSNVNASGGWLVDLESRELQRLSGGERWEGFKRSNVLWRDGKPILFDVRGQALSCYDPLSDLELSATLTGSFSLVGVASSGEVVLRDSTGVFSCQIPEVDTPDPVAARRRLTWPEGSEFMDAVLSDSGRWVIARSQADGANPDLFDLASGERRSLLGLHHVDDDRAQQATRSASYEPMIVPGRVLAAKRFGPYTIGFSPDERFLLIERVGGAIALIDLRSGTQRLFDPEVTSPPGWRVAWSPDGRLGTLPSGFTVDTVTGDRDSGSKVKAVGYVSNDLVITPGQFEVRERATGTPVAHPLKGGAE